MNKQQKQLIGSLMLLDGLMTLVFGKSYVRLWRFGIRSGLYGSLMDRLLSWPTLLLRLAGASEATAGIAMLRRSPFSVASIYGTIADSYASVDPDWRQWFYPSAHEAFNAQLKQLLTPESKVLDLGTGTGANMATIQALDLPFRQYIGVDRTPEMLANAQRRYGASDQVHFELLDLMRDPLPDGPFDLIISTWVFEHLDNPVEVAHKAWKQLKPDGTMLLLLEVEGSSLISRFMKWVYPALSLHLLTKQQVSQFPGLVDVQRFSGPVGDLAMVTIRKS